MEGDNTGRRLEKLEEIKDLRRIWKNEARDFTPWLAEEDNMSLLADAVGLDITVDEMESSVGDFNADIYATETNTGNRIIIENQLGDTNHDHLGKLITYASGKRANAIIWVVKHAREEHKAAIEWLNSHTDDAIGFFLCEIKLYKIGDSSPAVKFEVVEKPNEWMRKIEKDDSMNQTQKQRVAYWTAFEDYAFKDAKFAREFNRVKPSRDHWLDFAIGSSACHLDAKMIQKRDELVAELYIMDSKELFNSLHRGHKQDIEEETGLKFQWMELPNRKASRILTIKKVDFNDEGKWKEQFEWLKDALIRMKGAFRKYI